MNRIKASIEWADFSWNPLVGCTGGCPWCYARKMAKRMKQKCIDCYSFKPHLHPERLVDKDLYIRKPKKIFLGSMAEWNDPHMDAAWKRKVLDTCKMHSQHIYMILSKKPMGYDQFIYPSNIWLGTSITCHDDVYRIADLVRHTSRDNIRFVSIEPLRGAVRDFSWLDDIDWVIVGAETGNQKNKVVPRQKWIEYIINGCAAYNKPVFLKKNLYWPYNKDAFKVWPQPRKVM